MSTSSATLRIAVAQIHAELGELDGNLERHLAMITRARQQGAEVLLFPELSLTGYGLGRGVHEVAMDPDAHRLRQLADAAGDMFVTVGYVEEDHAARFFNAAAVLRRGEVVFNHRKLNLPTYGNLEEGKIFAPGRRIDTFALPRPFTASVLVCADLWNPAWVQLAALHGATVLLAPSNSAHDAVAEEFSNPQGWDTALRFYAMVFGLPVVFANRVGPEGKLHFWGGSRILDPFGEPLAHAGHAEETLLVADLPYEAIRRARFQLPTVRDSNPGLLRREIERLDSPFGPADGGPHR
jgi:predicted amidohydrolase